MSRLLPTVRPLSDAEALVLKRTLLVGATDQDALGLIDQIPMLQVVDHCRCGCASIDFQLYEEGTIPSVVADAMGKGPDGEDLGLIVFALDKQLFGLEVYNYSDNPAPLPTLESVIGYDGKRVVDAA
jgi:hypothetical protein